MKPIDDAVTEFNSLRDDINALVRAEQLGVSVTSNKQRLDLMEKLLGRTVNTLAVVISALSDMDARIYDLTENPLIAAYADSTVGPATPLDLDESEQNRTPHGVTVDRLEDLF